MSTSKNKFIFSFFFLLSFSFCFFGQTDTTVLLRNNAVKVFLDCKYPDYGSCDVDFMKREISFVNYVRDTKEAEVHILITRQNAGNGGKKYDIFFLGQKRFENQNDTLNFVSLADNTQDEIRDRQLKYLKLGLIKYVSHTQLAELLEINYTESSENKNEIVKDRWNSWIFKISSQTWLRGESSYSNLNLWSSIRAERVTPERKFVFNAGNNFSQSNFVISENETYTSTNKSYYGNALMVKSLNEHWSAGVKFSGGSSTFSNYNFYSTLYPSIEYNVYPYSESSVKQLTIRFGSGHKYANYIDTTIYNKLTENLFPVELSAAYKINKKWGNINTSISATDYLHDLSKYNIDIRTGLNIRLIKGLSVRLSGGGSFIRNQLNLKKSGATYEEILLRQQQVSTNYSYWMSAGLTYTFGSIYNNVVNPRFDN